MVPPSLLGLSQPRGVKPMLVVSNGGRGVSPGTVIGSLFPDTLSGADAGAGLAVSSISRAMAHVSAACFASSIGRLVIAGVRLERCPFPVPHYAEYATVEYKTREQARSTRKGDRRIFSCFAYVTSTKLVPAVMPVARMASTRGSARYT